VKLELCEPQLNAIERGPHIECDINILRRKVLGSSSMIKKHQQRRDMVMVITRLHDGDIMGTTLWISLGEW